MFGLYKILSDRKNRYSPSMIGFILIALSYLAMAMIENPVQPSLPKSVWFIGIVIFLTGVILQITTRRLFFIHIYQASVSLYLAITSGIAFGFVQNRSGYNSDQTILWIAILLIFLGGLLIGLVQSFRFKTRTKMIHGTSGLLNTKTALLDPTISPKNIDAEQQNTDGFARQLLSWSPLLVGVLMASSRIYGNETLTIQALIASIAGEILGALGGGSGIYFAYSTFCWERENEKQIYVK